MSVYIIWEELGLCAEIFWVISYQNTTVRRSSGILNHCEGRTCHSVIRILEVRPFYRWKNLKGFFLYVWEIHNFFNASPLFTNQQLRSVLPIPQLTWAESRLLVHFYVQSFFFIGTDKTERVERWVEKHFRAVGRSKIYGDASSHGKYTRWNGSTIKISCWADLARPLAEIKKQPNKLVQPCHFHWFLQTLNRNY